MKNTQIDFGNPLRNAAARRPMGPMPGNVLDAILDAMAQFHGTCWAPVEEVKDGESVAWRLMLNQCPGACGHVWSLVLHDRAIVDWLINEINQRRVNG